MAVTMGNNLDTMRGPVHSCGHQRPKAVALFDTADFYRIAASLKLDTTTRALLGQYMTPTLISRFMASLFVNTGGRVRVLDPGAGVGSLTAALAERFCNAKVRPRSVDFVCYEIDLALSGYLDHMLREVEIQCKEARVGVSSRVVQGDFILSHRNDRQPDMFADTEDTDGGFTHAILNPPYRKINTASEHRAALRRAGIETSNLYTGFMFLAGLRLREGGEMVAIVPRSFCNGLYFKPFREQFFSMMALRHIHLFEARDRAFKDDSVLQENIIVHAVKGGRLSGVTVTTSHGAALDENMTQWTVPYESVVRADDPERFVHIAANGIEQGIMQRMSHFKVSLADLGIEVSTGPVVQFRLRDDLRAMPEDDAVPLLYPAHFQGGEISWPKAMRKPNAIRLSDKSRKWLWPNKGNFVVTRRFTSKEERRRIVASLYTSDLPGEFVGFENHLNVYHVDRKGMPRSLALGLRLYLNCSLVDRFFRQFNGHTQVNATDLRVLRYPDRATLERIGRENDGQTLSQQEIDNIIEGEICHMSDDDNPLDAQRKIDDALAILKALGMPRGQQNLRSALTLLALVDIKPPDLWSDLERPLRGITPIMDYVRANYGQDYAPNTREAFRRETMHQFVEAGVAVYNPDDPGRSVNSPNACYQISEEAAGVIATYGTEEWEAALDAWLRKQSTLSEKWAKPRQMQMVPVKVAADREIELTPGPHSELIRDIIDHFAPRFLPGAELIYVGDTGDKIGYFQEHRLADLGVMVDPHGKMPDIVLYFGDKDWLVLVESTTSHGPVDAKRHNELAGLFANAVTGLVYVTAFPSRAVMREHLGDISWETEVWCADTPTHLIHFDGERFLGPYDRHTGLSP